MIINYDEHKTIDENSNLILKGIANYKFSSMNEQDLVILADSLFKLFKGNFENGNYSVMEEVANYCKTVVENCIDRKLYTKLYCGEIIIDIACFVFEQMYMYEEKVWCLKSIIHSNETDKTLKIIIETGEIKDIIAIKEATRLCIDADADFVKTSTGKTPVSATPQAANAILETIASSGKNIGFKASGGIKTTADAKDYLTLTTLIMGSNRINQSHFRIGASSLLDDLIKTIEQGY